MSNKSKGADKQVIHSNSQSDQDQVNKNIGQTLKEESKGEAYPEQANDAQEKEVFDSKEKED